MFCCTPLSLVRRGAYHSLSVAVCLFIKFIKNIISSFFKLTWPKGQVKFSHQLASVVIVVRWLLNKKNPSKTIRPHLMKSVRWSCLTTKMTNKTKHKSKRENAFYFETVNLTRKYSECWALPIIQKCKKLSNEL